MYEFKKIPRLPRKNEKFLFLANGHSDFQQDRNVKLSEFHLNVAFMRFVHFLIV